MGLFNIVENIVKLPIAVVVDVVKLPARAVEDEHPLKSTSKVIDDLLDN